MSKPVTWFEEELNPKTYIYRYFPLHRIIQLIQSRSIPLVHPAQWWDPLEQAWSEQSYQTVRRLAKKTLYGTCWTLGARNDALWQIYSRTAPAVRIRSRVGLLLDAMRSEVLSGGKLHAGKVRYCDESELNLLAQELQRATLKKDVGRFVVKGLMHKRQAFKFEDEFRVIWVKSGVDRRKFIDVPIDTTRLIDQIRIDPRLDEDLTGHLASALRLLSGIADVSRSSLAESPIG